MLGVILTDAASSAGQQRRAQLQKSALAAFVRAVREDPANATAKLDLEVLLAGHGPADEEPSLARRDRRPQATSGATRILATRPRPRARKERGSEPMAPLAQIVFLTPRAALVGLAFVVPLVDARDPRAGGRRVRVEPRPAPAGSRPPARPRPPGSSASRRSSPSRPRSRRVRDTDSTPVRADAELYPHVRRQPVDAGVERAGRRRAAGAGARPREESSTPALADVPTGVATLTNRMMPLLFPTGDERGVTAVIDHSLRIMQPRPERLTAARASSLAALGLAADRSYFDPSAAEARPRRLQRPRQRLLQPRRERCVCCDATGSSRSSFASPLRASESSTPPVARTPTSPSAR